MVAVGVGVLMWRGHVQDEARRLQLERGAEASAMVMAGYQLGFNTTPPAGAMTMLTVRYAQIEPDLVEDLGDLELETRTAALCLDFITKPAYGMTLVEQVRDRFGEVDDFQAQQIADAVRTAYCDT